MKLELGKVFDFKTWFGKGKMDPTAFWLCSLVPMGQLYARVEIMNGSLDQPWTMFPLFMVPPFQFVPIIMMNIGIIKKGKGGKPYDWYMIIPILSKILISVVNEQGVPINKEILFFITYISIFIPFIIRSHGYCKEFNLEGTYNSSGLSAYVLAVINIFQFILPLIPILGIAASSVELSVPVVGSALVWSMAYIPGYVLANMYAGSEVKKYCTKFNYTIWTIVISFAVAFATN